MFSFVILFTIRNLFEKSTKFYICQKKTADYVTAVEKKVQSQIIRNLFLGGADDYFLLQKHLHILTEIFS